MRHLDLFAFLTGMLVALTGCVGSGDDDDPMQKDLDELAASELEARDVLGIGISVRLADGRVYETQAGDIDPTGSEAYSVGDTQQVIGSVTKMYVATMIMQLVEEGVLSLDDTIDAWVTVPSGDRITIRMLLSHTSGLNDCIADMTLEEEGMAWTPEQLLARAIARGPLAEPGDVYARYTNTNFLILAMILEQETGKTWTDNLAERIAEPLGLERTSSVTLPETAAVVTAGWAFIDGNWYSSLDYVNPSIGWGYGAMAATNRELMIFGAAFFDAELFESASTLQEMMRFEHEVDRATQDPQEPPIRMGLAVHHYDMNGIVLEGHLGHAMGYNAAMLRDPETGAIIVVTVNTHTNTGAGLTAGDVASYLRSN